MDYRNQFLLGNVMDVLRQLPAESIDCCVTSPPYYGLRTYGGAETVWGGTDGCEHRWVSGIKKGITGGKDNPFADKLKIKGVENYSEVPDSHYAFCSLCSAWRGELGLEPTPELYLTHLWGVFDEVWRVMRRTGTCFVNLGDTYNSAGGRGRNRYFDGREDEFGPGNRPANDPRCSGSMGVPQKCLLAVPERFMLGMIDRGWILRNKIVWHKPNPMPSSAKDRFTNTYEPVYFFTKAKRYWFDLDAVRERPATGLDRVDKIQGWKHKDGYLGQDTGYARDGREFSNNPSGKNPGDVWRITTQPFPEAHFATFPEELARRCIKAGCPRMVCPECGKAPARVVRVSKRNLRREPAHVPGNTPTKVDSTGWKPAEREAIGWTDCGCSMLYVPGIVLDPFGGSGRACHVAWEQGRDFTYIDIKLEYIEMAKEGLERKMRSIPRAGDDRQAETIGQATLKL